MGGEGVQAQYQVEIKFKKKRKKKDKITTDYLPLNKVVFIISGIHYTKKRGG